MLLIFRVMPLPSRGGDRAECDFRLALNPPLTRPDTQVLDAIRPAMSTVPTTLMSANLEPQRLVCALWNAYRDD